MSSYIVPDHHINTLITWANRQGQASRQVTYWWQGKHRNFTDDVERCASVLYAENVRSVNARYREATPADGFVFDFVRVDRLQAVDIIKACHGYQYQASDTADFEQSEAYAMVQGIEQAAIRTLPGYAESRAWCLDSRVAA
jgi:hypothetical protein